MFVVEINIQNTDCFWPALLDRRQWTNSPFQCPQLVQRLQAIEASGVISEQGIKRRFDSFRAFENGAILDGRPSSEVVSRLVEPVSSAGC